MKSIALRFSDNFAPNIGTIAEHEFLIEQYGYVWYGKLGAKISEKTITTIMSEEDKRILLIHSGKTERYWAYIEKIQNVPPEKEYIPQYYREKRDSFGTWFRINKIVAADKDVLSKCKVVSSGAVLSEASKKSMSPCFIIEYIN